jgi:protein tyrosine/serine phosphatase
MNSFRLPPSTRGLWQTLAGAVLLALALGAPPPAAAQAARKPEWAVPIEKSTKLYRVTPTFYRSARLGQADLPLVHALGIKTVVSLRAFHSDADLMRNTGIKAVNVRINTWSIGDEQVVAALRAIRAAEREGPVLLHCLHGADRTGLIAAMYRILYQGWSKDAAFDELKNGGYGYHSIWKNIESYLSKVDIDQIRQRVERG